MALSIMKSFKVLALLSLAATLSCGFPTNVTQATTDGSTQADSFIKVIKRNTQAKDLLAKTYIDPIIKAAIAASHKKSAEFTKNLVEGMWDNNNNFNYVVCGPAHRSDFDGVEGVDWARGYPAPSYNYVNFHVFVAGSGTFTRHGVGGYGNWAWKGSVVKGQDLHSNVVKFVKPGSISSDIGSGGD